MLNSKLVDVLQFHTGLFPELKNAMLDIAFYGIKLASQDLSADRAIVDVAVEKAMETVIQAVDLLAVNFLTVEETEDVRTRIDTFQHSKSTGKNARSGGSQLLKELEKVEHSKAELMKWIGNIRGILAPATITRITTAQIRAEADSKAAAKVLKAEQDSIARIAESLCGMKESMLRSFAEAVIGKDEQDYCKDELALVIATKQITGVTLAPKEL